MANDDAAVPAAPASRSEEFKTGTKHSHAYTPNRGGYEQEYAYGAGRIRTRNGPPESGLPCNGCGFAPGEKGGPH